MNDQLPWGWLNAAPDLVTPEQQQRDIAATVEAVTFHAIVAHWDDVVPCASIEKCTRPSYWAFPCPCGERITVCTPHRVWLDNAGPLVCSHTRQPWPSPIPWLPL